jgi:Fe-S-cluster-containing hydrogenase component 2
MNRKIFYRPDRCMLCSSCVLACQLHSLGVSDVREVPRGRSPIPGISVDISRGTPWASKCRHCVSPLCVEACVTGSLVKGDEAVVHHRETCVGCGSCLLVCPFSALTYDENGEKMTKCNSCPEEKVPPCVGACQSKALVCRSPEIFASEKKKKFARELKRSHEAD